MEKTPAAFAMDWSIHLEKSLRSKKPGKCIEAIQEIGANLEWWNTEPKLTMAQYNLFNLIPGEDELFANAIALRLADAFSAGDKNTKLRVVKVFLSHYKCRRKGKERSDGILSRRRLSNYLEILRRVKMVFENGDVEVRAMALVLIGCWADFVHDSAEIRYLVLSNAVSSDVMEAKAALFAAGCFCELSVDFASVLLEILVNILSSSETSMGIRLAGARALAKMGRLNSLASKAFKAGLKQLSDSSEEEFCVAMLISLSKIAIKSALLNSTQVELLFTILNQGGSLQLQMTSLKCLHAILEGGAYSFRASTDEIKAIFSLLNEHKLPPAMLCNALQILHKILLQNLFNLSCPDMLEILSELLRIVENGVNFSTMSKRLLATFVLVDIYSKFIGGGEVELGSVKFHSIASRVVTFLIDRIFLLMELHPRELETEQPEVCSLLNFLLRLVQEPSDLCYMVLEKIQFSIKRLVEKHDRVMGGYGLGLFGHESHAESKTVMTSNLILKLSKVLASCIESVGNSGASTLQVHASLKLVVEAVHSCKLFDRFTHTIYSILFWSHSQSCCFWNGVEKNCVLLRISGIPDVDFPMQYELFILDCSNTLLAGRNNWLAYKAGRYAACQGAWFAAAFIFSQLAKLVQSHACSFWIKSLTEFTHSEMEIQCLLLPERGYGLLNWVESYGISGVSLGCDLHATEKGTASKVISSNHINNLHSVCKILHSSEEFLGSSGRSTAFIFQRWFLSLRVKVIENVVDMLKLLDTIPLTEDKISRNVQVNGANLSMVQESVLNVNSLVHSLTQMSIRFKKSAQEFDLMASSFIDMDCKSFMTISALALSCSLLAFSFGFYVIISNLHTMKSSTNSGLEKSDKSWPEILILDLLSRLWNVDIETSKKLLLLLDSYQQPRNHFSNRFSNRGLDVGTETSSIINICSFAVAGAVGLQNDAPMHHDLNQSQLTSSYLQLLLNIITRWLQLPFRAPTHFFRIRPPLSAQLFTVGIDSRQGTGLSISTGFHLSLNLCIQLSNMPRNLPTRLTKLYCILSTKISYQVPCPVGGETTQAELSFQDWQTDDMVDLNEKLLHYVTGHMKTSSKHTSNNAAGDSGNVEVYACFEPNAKGQGFSTCLLDVSAFPVGSYRIKWHSCCIDSEGSYWSLLPLNPGPVLTVQ